MKIKTLIYSTAGLGLSLGVAQAATSFTNSHLVNYWNFDDDTTAITQTSYTSDTGTGTGTVTNEGTLTSVAGAGLIGSNVTDKAVNFTTGPSNFFVGVTGVNYDSFSISFHVKTAQTVAFRDYLSIGTNAGNQFYLESTDLGGRAGGLAIYNGGEPGGASPDTILTRAAGATPINNDTWRHIGMTSDGSNLKLYVDGALVGTTGYTGTGAISLLQAASRLGDSGRGIVTAEDDMSLWNTALTDGQMNFLSTNVAADLVPEPSSTALLGLGGLALILRRRK